MLDLQPFIWEGFETGVRYTYRLAIGDLKAALAGMDPTRRNDLRLATKQGIRVESGASFQAVLDLCRKTFLRQGKQAGFADTAIGIEAALSRARRCCGFIARDAAARPLSACWIAWDDKRAYYLIGGYDADAESSKAGALALWTAIDYTANVLRLPEFDFEGSMLPPIERFFRKFGGELMPTYTVWRRPRGLAQRSKERLRSLLASAGLA